MAIKNKINKMQYQLILHFCLYVFASVYFSRINTLMGVP